MSSTSERRIKEVEEFVKELCSQGQKIGLEGAILFNDMELIDQQAILRRDKFYLSEWRKNHQNYCHPFMPPK